MAQKADGTIIINTKIDIRGLEDGGKEIQKSFEKTADSTKSFTKEASAAQKGAEKLNDELSDTSKQAKKAEEKIDRVNETLDDTDSSAASAQKGLGDVFGQMFSASALADVAIGALKEVGAALKDLAIESIQAAADLRAENAQFSETFKELEKTATKSLDNIAKDVGISASRMKKSYTKSFAFVKSIGADSEEAMNIANRAMVAAADSAAYYDVTVEQATETLQSFLKGNYENDAALGIAATETTRNAKANELYAKSFDKLSESQKVDVLLAMVEAGNAASGALGQAAREADSWTNVTGELQEAWRQLLGVLGDPILDALTPMLQGISDAIYSIIEQSEADVLRENMEAFSESITKANENYKTTEAEITQVVQTAGFYVSRLKELEEAGLNTAVAHKEYELCVQSLNALIPELNLVIDEQTGLITADTAAVLDNIQAWEEQAIAKAVQAQFTEVLNARADAMGALLTAEAQLNMLGEQEETILIRLNALTSERNALTEKSSELMSELYGNEDLTVEEQEKISRQLEKLSEQYAATGSHVMELSGSLEENRSKQAELRAECESAKETFDSYAADMENARSAMELYNSKYKQTSDGIKTGQQEISDATGVTSDTVEELGESYAGTDTTAKKVIPEQKKLFQELDKCAADVAAEVSDLQRELNQLTGRTVYIDVIERRKVQSSTYPVLSTRAGAAAQATAAAISSYEVPQLAKGAVIPPNAPFMAVLGDQRSGTNIEAPLETIQEAVADVMGKYIFEASAAQEGTTEVLRDILQAVMGIEIGDETIGAAAGRYNSRRAVMRGGG